MGGPSPSERTRPLAAEHLAPFGGTALDQRYGYLVHYGPNANQELGFHVDDSEVTLNLCLEKEGSGAELVMLGERCDLHRQQDPELALEGQLLSLLASLGREARCASSGPPWLRLIDEALRDTLPKPLSLASLAELACVDAAHLERVYRQHRGMSVGAAARAFRLDEALRRIRHTQESIVSIATALGFYDQAHLTRAFKARYGSTPGRVRRG